MLCIRCDTQVKKGPARCEINPDMVNPLRLLVCCIALCVVLSTSSHLPLSLNTVHHHSFTTQREATFFLQIHFYLCRTYCTFSYFLQKSFWTFTQFMDDAFTEILENWPHILAFELIKKCRFYCVCEKRPHSFGELKWLLDYDSNAVLTYGAALQMLTTYLGQLTYLVTYLFVVECVVVAAAERDGWVCEVCRVANKAIVQFIIISSIIVVVVIIITVSGPASAQARQLQQSTSHHFCELFN